MAETRDELRQLSNDQLGDLAAWSRSADTRRMCSEELKEREERVAAAMRVIGEMKAREGEQ